MPVERDDFLAALSRFPSGVTIVTTLDAAGTPWGFTASSFCSLSMAPPQVLVCLANDADCYPAFESSDRLTVNVLATGHARLARHFATKGVDKFGYGAFTPGADGVPVLEGAVAVLECRTAARLPGGDHTILVGDVVTAVADEGEPALYVDRAFRAVNVVNGAPEG